MEGDSQNHKYHSNYNRNHTTHTNHAKHFRVNGGLFGYFTKIINPIINSTINVSDDGNLYATLLRGSLVNQNKKCMLPLNDELFNFIFSRKKVENGDAVETVGEIVENGSKYKKIMDNIGCGIGIYHDFPHDLRNINVVPSITYNLDKNRTSVIGMGPIIRVTSYDMKKKSMIFDCHGGRAFYYDGHNYIDFHLEGNKKYIDATRNVTDFVQSVINDDKDKDNNYYIGSIFSFDTKNNKTKKYSSAYISKIPTQLGTPAYIVGVNFSHCYNTNIDYAESTGPGGTKESNKLTNKCVASIFGTIRLNRKTGLTQLGMTLIGLNTMSLCLEGREKISDYPINFVGTSELTLKRNDNSSISVLCGLEYKYKTLGVGIFLNGVNKFNSFTCNPVFGLSFNL
jgi:hypothetical protein